MLMSGQSARWPSFNDLAVELDPRVAAGPRRRGAAGRADVRLGIRDRQMKIGTIDLAVLAELRATGLSVIQPLEPNQVEEVNRYLLNLPVYHDAHVQHTALDRGESLHPDRDLLPFAERLCVSHRDALLAPHLLERAVELSDLAAAYLGTEPVIYSANAFWTRPGPTAPFWDIQDFHRDADDERFLALFTLLTDVLEPEAGAHELIGPDGSIRAVLGPAGTTFLADTSHLHRGLKPRLHERGLHWFRYGISDPPPAYAWDGLVPISHLELGDRYPPDPRARTRLRLLVAPPPPA